METLAMIVFLIMWSIVVLMLLAGTLMYLYFTVCVLLDKDKEYCNFFINLLGLLFFLSIDILFTVGIYLQYNEHLSCFFLNN